MLFSQDVTRKARIRAKHFGDFSSLEFDIAGVGHISLFFGEGDFPNHQEIASAMADAFNSRVQPAGTRVAPAVVAMLEDDL